MNNEKYNFHFVRFVSNITLYPTFSSISSANLGDFNYLEKKKYAMKYFYSILKFNPVVNFIT